MLVLALCHCLGFFLYLDALSSPSLFPSTSLRTQPCHCLPRILALTVSGHTKNWMSPPPSCSQCLELSLQHCGLSPCLSSFGAWLTECHVLFFSVPSTPPSSPGTMNVSWINTFFSRQTSASWKHSLNQHLWTIMWPVMIINQGIGCDLWLWKNLSD